MALLDGKICGLMAVIVVLGNHDVSPSKQIMINFEITIADLVINVSSFSKSQL